MIVVSGAGALHAVGAAFPGDFPLPPFRDPFVTVTCCVVVVVVRVVPGSSSSSPFTVIYSVSVSVSVSVTALPCSLGASVFCGDAPLPFVTVTVDGAGHAASSAARICATPKLVPCATGDALTPPATAANAAARWSSFIYASQNGRWLRGVFFRAVPSFLLPLVQFFFLSWCAGFFCVFVLLGGPVSLTPLLSGLSLAHLYSRSNYPVHELACISIPSHVSYPII